MQRLRNCATSTPRDMTPAETLRAALRDGKNSSLEDALAQQLRAHRIAFERELMLPGRKFRFDFAFPEFGLLVEVQGGTWTEGAHSSGVGIERDAEKAAHAITQGWRVMPVTGGQVKSGKAVQWIS